MTLLRDLTRSITKAASERPPQTPMLATLTSMIGQNLGLIPQMQAQSQSAVLFSIINVIGEGVSSVEWELFQTGGRERRKIESHPFLDLWDRPNMLTTRMEFLEASQQHMDLTGEFWWVIVQDRGQPELWLVRPDRMRVIPDPEEIVSGYEYRIGQARVPLRVEDVVFQKMPNPMDFYRGLGPVGALLVDQQGEKAATDWQRQFFRNNATPGGIMEVDEGLSDSEFNKMLEHWDANHKGVSNAGRIAFIERAKFHELKLTHRDMQFEPLRRFNIDLFLLAFRVHKHILGIADDVNRANAEAAEVSFVRWVLKPRLERIKGAVNEQLLPLFGEGLEIDYVDPTPEDREWNLREATEGFSGKLLTKNESRLLLGYDEVEGGEEFAPEPVSPFALGGDADVGAGDNRGFDRRILSGNTNGDLHTLLKAPNDDLIEDPVQRAETAIQRGWQRRLQKELAELSEYIAERMKAWAPIMKIELSDIMAYDWDWWDKYGDEVTDELARAFEAVALQSAPGMLPQRAQELATAFARYRAGELLRLDGTLSMVKQTQERVRQLVSQTIEEGQSLQRLRSQLQDDIVFSRRRAETVARTETRIAMGQGQKGAAIEQGRDQKRWVTQGRSDPRVDPECLTNEAQGWIDIEQPFQSGQDTVPAHPNCMCTVIYRMSEQHTSAEAPRHKCQDCGATLMLNKDGPGLYCRRCKEVKPEPIQSGRRRVIERDEYGRISGIQDR